jgi:putative spermidine/putrescine transport system permease protein
MNERLGDHPFVIALAMLALALLVIPVILIVGVSLNAGVVQQFPPDGLSLRWYVAALARQEFRESALRSVVLATVSSGVSVVIGTLGALALARYRFRWRKPIEVALLSPLLVPQVVIGMAFLVLMVQLRVASLTMLAVLHIILTLPFAVRVIGAALVKADMSL